MRGGKRANVCEKLSNLKKNKNGKEEKQEIGLKY